MSAKINYSETMDFAANTYPVIKSTLNMLKRTDMIAIRHQCTMTKRGNVYQHRLLIKFPDGDLRWYTNENIKSIVRIYYPKNKKA